MEIRCPIIAPKNDTMMMVIEFFGVLWKTSTPNSNIFCPMAVEIARKAPIGSNNHMYFFIIHRVLGRDTLSVCRNGLATKWIS